MAFETFNFAPYVAADHCSGSSTPGAKSLLAYLEDRFPYQNSMGIYACRPPRGGTGYSHHAEGRAYDCGLPVQPGMGLVVINLLGPHGRRLGIDHMIYNLKPNAPDRGSPYIWSAKYPKGRTYTGVHPHKDHGHIGLTEAAGARLNYATLVDVLGPANQPATPDPDEDDDMGFRTITKTSHPDTIAQMQDLMHEAGITPTVEQGWKTDGIYGPMTADVVKKHLFKYTGADESAAPGSDMANGYIVNYNMWNGLNQLWGEKKFGKASATTNVDQPARDAAAAAQKAADKANASLDKIRKE